MRSLERRTEWWNYDVTAMVEGFEQRPLRVSAPAYEWELARVQARKRLEQQYGRSVSIVVGEARRVKCY